MRSTYLTTAGRVSATSKSQAMFAARRLTRQRELSRARVARLLDDAKLARTQPYYTGGDNVSER